MNSRPPVCHTWVIHSSKLLNVFPVQPKPSKRPVGWSEFNFSIWISFLHGPPARVEYCVPQVEGFLRFLNQWKLHHPKRFLRVWLKFRSAVNVTFDHLGPRLNTHYSQLFAGLSLLFSLVQSQVMLLASFFCLSAELNVWMCECLDRPRYCSALPELILYAAGCRALAVLNATPGGFSSMQWLFQSSALGWAWMSVKRRREETPKSEEMGSIDSSAH